MSGAASAPRRSLTLTKRFILPVLLMKSMIPSCVSTTAGGAGGEGGGVAGSGGGPFRRSYEHLYVHIREGAEDIKRLIADLYVEVIRSRHRYEYIRQNSGNTAPYEVGYMVHLIFDQYRKMVDRYTTSVDVGGLYYVTELVIYLDEIENLYWVIEHTSKMAHEIERKFEVKTPLKQEYHELTRKEEYELYLKAIQAELEYEKQRRRKQREERRKKSKRRPPRPPQAGTPSRPPVARHLDDAAHWPRASHYGWQLD
ncbi:uncharacterized protein LOC142974170 [Anticarsia gemmatalis]|uniref:uncharacterized protein LOC142974170 n=1 Tax=Anticarsia gemmatalis TaxID=129554 RepID=UPI003F761F5B